MNPMGKQQQLFISLHTFLKNKNAPVRMRFGVNLYIVSFKNIGFASLETFPENVSYVA